MSRKKDGEEVKKRISMRVEPWVLKEFEKYFGQPTTGICEIATKWAIKERKKRLALKLNSD